jgi:myo-inositol 2-dehydrogenase / D-chiro-inositol 1-dehydrogenase
MMIASGGAVTTGGTTVGGTVRGLAELPRSMTSRPLASPVESTAPSPRDAMPRRTFVSAAAGGVAAGLFVHTSTPAAETPREIRIGIVGCGGRGSGAVNDSLTINDGVKLVAAADLYPQKAASLCRAIAAAHPGKIDCDESRMFGGLDGVRRVLDLDDVDLVFITTSPGFRPRYVREAVEAGKHVFAEKPACVDPAGYRICLAAHDAAVARGTAIVAGTQYRRQSNYVAAVEKIRDGAIGDVIAASTRYCSGGIWYRPRTAAMSDTEYQLNNWMHFIWLSGDQITEQAVHNLDLMNWVMDANPRAALASGGRFTRPADSEMWDSMSVEYDYGGRAVTLACRQIPGAASDIGSVIHGARGRCHIGGADGGSRIVDLSGETVWEMGGSIAAAYRREHKDLVDSIRAGRPIVELRQMADSSMVAVLGRMAAYTGQRVTWDFATGESTLDLFPAALVWDGELPKPQHAVPGRTKLV